MSETNLSVPGTLSDDDLTAELRRLVFHERRATATVLSHLAEFDARRLYLGAGFSSLFDYCTRALRYSGQAAYNRIEAARASRKFPVILELLASGALNLTNLRLLAPHLTLENQAPLLTEAAGKSRLQVEELLARRFPRPAVAPSVRKLPASAIDTTAAASCDDAPTITFSSAAGLTGVAAASPSASPSAASASSPTHDETSSALATPSLSTPRPVIAPLAVDRYKITFTASEATHRKLRQAQELLRHQVPDGDLAQVVDRALEALLEQLTRRKFAAVNRSRNAVPAVPGVPCVPGPGVPGVPSVPGVPTALSEPGAIPSPAGRHIPADVRRAVWRRDGGSCAFVGREGRRCGERSFVEFHHLRPFAVGGPPTMENIALRCRSHNGHEAELYFAPSRRWATAQPP